MIRYVHTVQRVRHRDLPPQIAAMFPVNHWETARRLIVIALGGMALFALGWSLA